MRKMLFKYLSLLPVALMFFFSSCETEVDLFTDGEQVPVVFALLEPANDIQYFRINPTFKGDGDARDLAGDPTITSYNKGDIEVKLIQVERDGNTIEYLLKDSVGMKNLESGGIFNSQNRIYYLETPVTLINNGGRIEIENSILIPGNTYRLEIKNLKNNQITTSEIVLGDINKLRMITPRRGTSQFSTDWIVFYTGSDYNKSFTFDFDADLRSERFLLEMEYYYTSGQQDSNSKDSSIVFEIGEESGVDAFSDSKRISLDYDGERFYSILKTKLPLSNNRTGQAADLTITAVGEDLDTYVAVQGATLNSISQETPSYSNIENGLGIFSYRLKRTYTEFYVTEATAKHLFNGPYTIERFRCARHGTQGSSLGVIPCR